MAVVEPGSERKGPGDSGAIWLARSLILAIPLVVMALFWVFAPFPTAPPMHGPSQLPRQAQAPGQAQTAPPGGDPARMSDAEMETMAARLAARLQREPRDANGWSVLARTYYVMERFTQAVSAYEKLVLDKLETLEARVDAVDEKVVLVRIDVAQLKVKSGMWGAAAGFVPALVTALVVFLSGGS